MFDLWPVMQKCTVVAKRELFFAWPFGLAAWLCGLIFINRMQSEHARDSLHKASDSIKSKKIKLWIFPEGTRRNTGQLHPFKKGAFHVAIDAQIPILPVVFSSYKTFLDDRNKHLDSGHIIITTLPPISTVGITKNGLDDLMQRTYDAMNHAFQMTSKEVAAEYAKSKHGQYIRSQDQSQVIFVPSQNTAYTINNPHQQHSLSADVDFNAQHTIQNHNHRTLITPTAN